MPSVWRAFQRLSTGSKVALKTTQCVCKCGSSSRLVSWRKHAATTLPVAREPFCPFCGREFRESFEFCHPLPHGAMVQPDNPLVSMSATIETLFGGLIVKSWKIRRFAVSFPCSLRTVFEPLGQPATGLWIPAFAQCQKVFSPIRRLSARVFPPQRPSTHRDCLSLGIVVSHAQMLAEILPCILQV